MREESNFGLYKSLNVALKREFKDGITMCFSKTKHKQKAKSKRPFKLNANAHVESIKFKLHRSFYMIYSYIRVSSDKQTVKNQRYEIEQYALGRGIVIDQWVEEVVSGVKNAKDRKLGRLLKKMKTGDILIVSELSRLGRNLLQIMSMLNFCMENDLKIISIKEGYELGDNLNSKVLAFAFGLSAEIERQLISQRTKEALARKKAEGVVLGRPPACNKYLKLNGKEDKIRKMLEGGYSKAEITKKLKVSRVTLNKFIIIRGL